MVPVCAILLREKPRRPWDVVSLATTRDVARRSAEDLLAQERRLNAAAQVIVVRIEDFDAGRLGRRIWSSLRKA